MKNSYLFIGFIAVLVLFGGFAAQVHAQATTTPPVTISVTGPTTLMIGQTGTWTVSANDVWGGLSLMKVSWGDGTYSSSTLNGSSTAVRIFQHLYSSVGTKYPSFSVYDTTGFTASTTKVVQVTLTPTSSQSILVLSLLSGSGASPSQDRVVNVGTNNQTEFAFRLSSQYDPIKIRMLKLTTTNGQLHITSLRNIRIYEGNASLPFAQSPQFDSCSLSGSCTVTWSATDNLLSQLVSPTSSVNLTVKADVSPAGIAYLGDSFAFSIGSTFDVRAISAVTSLPSTVIGTPKVFGRTYIAPQIVDISGYAPQNPVIVGTASGQSIGIFKLENSGTAPVYLTDVSYIDNGVSTPSMVYGLHASVQGGTPSDTSIAYRTNSPNTAFGNIESVVETSRTVDGGLWKYLTTKTGATACNNDTFQLGVSGLGYVKYSVKESDLGYDGNFDGDLLDIIRNLYVNGTPTLATITAKDGGCVSTSTPTYTLSVQKFGTGSGTATGPGIYCGTDCTESYVASTTVTLTASANKFSRFAGWAGCDSATGTNCMVRMYRNRSVAVGFNLINATTSPAMVSASLYEALQSELEGIKQRLLQILSQLN